MRYSPMPPSHFTLEVFPKLIRSVAVATFAAAWGSRPSNHARYGLDPSARTYSSTRTLTPSIVTYPLPLRKRTGVEVQLPVALHRPAGGGQLAVNVLAGALFGGWHWAQQHCRHQTTASTTGRMSMPVYY